MFSGRDIRKIRKMVGLTQEQFGEIFYQTRQTVSAWESGRIDLPKAYWQVMGILKRHPTKAKSPLRVLLFSLKEYFGEQE